MSESPRSIAFDRHKYGMPLLVDACSVASIPGFITEPMPHRLGFYEIALVTAGRGRLELDGAAAEVAPGTVLVTRPGEIGPALDRALDAGVPYVVNVLTDPADVYPRSSNLG